MQRSEARSIESGVFRSGSKGYDISGVGVLFERSDGEPDLVLAAAL